MTSQIEKCAKTKCTQEYATKLRGDPHSVVLTHVLNEENINNQSVRFLKPVSKWISEAFNMPL